MRLVVRVGGSVVASPFSPGLMSEYVDLLLDLKRGGHVVACVVGGGSLSRERIRTAKGMGLDEAGQDEVAISVSRLVAQLFVLRLGESGAGRVPVAVDDAAKLVDDGKIVVMGGLKPGMTTDTVAALIAESINAEVLIKGTDQEGVYDKDPRKFSDASKLDRLSFEVLSRVLTEDKHKAGIHQIIDPEAVKVLKKRKVKVVVVNGSRPENVLKAVSGECVGTVIE